MYSFKCATDIVDIEGDITLACIPRKGDFVLLKDKEIVIQKVVFVDTNTGYTAHIEGVVLETDTTPYVGTGGYSD